MKGFPKMTLSVIFLTRTKVVLKHTLYWQTCAFGILNSICIFPPLAEVNLSLVFRKYLEGMIPSVLTLNIKTHGTLVLHGTRQLALIYRVYYTCMRPNMSIQSTDKRKAGETTLIQTPDVRSTVQVPRTLKWSEVTFLAHWTIDNENYPLQVQNPVRNPNLDFVQQLVERLDLALTNLGLGHL